MRWTTIGLSAGQLNPAAAQEAKDEPRPRDRKKQIATVWIPAILGIGLLTAFAYLGVRIVAAKSTAPVVPAIHPVAAALPIVPKETPAKPAATRSTPDFSVIDPRSGERYVQVVAVSPHMVLKYVDDLRKLDLEAVVAPGPTPDLLRILVGPFPDRDAANKAKQLLEASGRHPFIRVY